MRVAKIDSVMAPLCSFLSWSRRRFFGNLSDGGYFNVSVLPIEFWGRRAPMMLISIPMSIAGYIMNFCPLPSLDKVALVGWFFMVKFLIVPRGASSEDQGMPAQRAGRGGAGGSSTFEVLTSDAQGAARLPRS